MVMARKHLEGADIALLVIDATEGVSQLDAAIAGYAHESGRSMIIVVNKWDLVTGGALKPGRPSKAMRMRESKRPGDREAYEERSALRSQVSELRAHRFYFSEHRQRHGENISAARTGRHRAAQAHLDVGDEPLH